MSLIEEALRRLQDPSLPTLEQAPPPAPPPKQARAANPAAPPPQSTPIHPWSTTASPSPASTSVLIALVAAVLLLTIALLVGGAWWIGRTAETRQTTLRHQTAPSLALSRAPRTPDPRARRLPAATPAPEDSLVLSGVVEGEGEPYAVINGAIVTVGERIGEFTLEEIANGAARLQRADGSEAVLRVPR